MNKGFINVVFIVFSLIMSVVLGQWVVTDPELAGIAIAGFAAIALFIILQKHVWMLIPAFSVLSISFPWIPGNFAPVELASIYVIACSMLLLVTRKISLRVRMTSVEWMAVLVGVMLLQSFLRNPVGIRMLGSGHIGGRPYFIVVLALAAGIILASTKTDHNRISKLFIWSVACYMGSLVIQALAYTSGAIAHYTGILFGAHGRHSPYAPVGVDAVDAGRADRNSAASALAGVASRCLVAYKHPLKSLMHPFWAMVLLTALIGAGMSGYRNVIASTGLTLIFGVYYWGRGRAVLLALVMALICYMGINVVNIVKPLPANIQRSLSFLPGTWHAEHLEDAQGSTDWRLEMWKDALFTDRYINNKLFGDGLGIRRHDFEHMMAITNSQVISDEMSQERAMLAGDYHSGPVTTIRVIGYVGLIALVIAMLVLAVRAHKLIMHSRGQPYFREVIFFCLPMVWSPLYFLFVFGSFKSLAPILFVQMGLLRLLEINLRDANRAGLLYERSPDAR